ncbi:unnamed protein product [Rotaria magnacalcarata]|uniref:Uncharacterized protein n=1 Tax=Rotaria magnacalcarata TaxID=392030 RepID=A0A816YVZ5_9BILA|nr:unnamed protein product [Rotaria magnacalcarata]CAF2171012.1 unnamed protein product [Rotaria magnacalcarata]CAF4130910.1 unnamed protein product [Rotaria magnacalcarata]CAF4205805.1 unnamed protein product [Rotaria magnacalcarata]
MCSSYGYKALPYLQAVIAICEFALGIVRIVVYFSPKPSISPTSVFGTGISNGTDISSPLMSSTQVMAAFALDWIASIVPTFMAVYITIFMLIATCSVCVACLCITKAIACKNSDTKGSGTLFRVLCLMCLSKPNHRCVSLTCNCPCYKARPFLRFQVRLGLSAFFLLLRIIAIILYASAKNVSVYGAQMAVYCTASVGLLLLSMGLDLYQYRIWWHYKPDGLYKKCRCLCCRQHLHPSHKRFLPIPLLGKFRDAKKLGDRPCEFTVSGGCPNRSLEHIVSFHAFDFKPLRRFQPGKDKTYIGFHQTTTEAAIGISQEGFRKSMKPPQMLGFGVYFARSFADTEGKARAAGAFIVAEINMGHVRMIERAQIDEVRNTDSWWKEFDTIYLKHEEEKRDEFCIKDPSQILKWIMVMNDGRLYRYGLDQEFANTHFGCI